MAKTRQGHRRTPASEHRRKTLTTPIEKPASPKKPKTKNGIGGKKRQTKATPKIEECESGCTCEAMPSNDTANLLAVSHPDAELKGAATDKIVFASEQTSFKRIKEDNVQLVVWRRKAVPTFVTTLSDPSIQASALPTFSGLVTPSNVTQAMTSKLQSRKKRALTDDDIDELVSEVSQLVSMFSKLTKTRTVFVKLETLSDNGCAYWHQDCVPFRLVTTYRGPCTEWVHPDLSKATLRRRQFDSKHAQSLSHYDVALFKGRGETEYGDPLLGNPGIVHRSPRMEGSGVYRVVLVLDIPSIFHEA